MIPEKYDGDYFGLLFILGLEKRPVQSDDSDSDSDSDSERDAVIAASKWDILVLLQCDEVNAEFREKHDVSLQISRLRSVGLQTFVISCAFKYSIETMPEECQV